MALPVETGKVGEKPPDVTVRDDRNPAVRDCAFVSLCGRFSLQGGGELGKDGAKADDGHGLAMMGCRNLLQAARNPLSRVRQRLPARRNPLEILPSASLEVDVLSLRQVRGIGGPLPEAFAPDKGDVKGGLEDRRRLNRPEQVAAVHR